MVEKTLVVLGIIALLLISALSTYLYIRRLQQKFGPDAKPTVWTYVNELGDYAIVGIGASIGAFGWLIIRLFEP